MRCGVNLPMIGSASRLVELALATEECGWDGFFLWDHLQLSPSGPAVHDPWVLLGAVAARTSRVRLGTLVTPVARRRPWKLARELITLDHLSGGRVVFGVGLGVPVDLEYAAFGESSSPRVHASMLDEALPLMDAFLRGSPVDHDGPHYTVHARLAPAAVQDPRPPIWVAGTLPHRRPIERALRWDGYFPLDMRTGEAGLTAPALAEVVESMNPPEGFDIVTLYTGQSTPSELEAAGATWLIDGPSPDDEGLKEIERRILAGPPR
jgi:alkanesulfonate monooxygenase SsuD/methylene tetrahydromethanopterin reductase-like flavin-dependent oxidoreductase (luciferase family)